jgi:hypothetical protein
MIVNMRIIIAAAERFAKRDPVAATNAPEIPWLTAIRVVEDLKW